MSKITPVIYEEVDPNIWNNKQSSEFYFYQNTLSLHNSFIDGYERYQERELKVRNEMLGRINRERESKANISSTIFGSSGTKKNVVLIVET